jgi:arylsulfatase A
MKDDWKLIRLDVKNPELTRLELYNLQNDIDEQNNRAEESPEKVAELLQLMEENHTENPWFKLMP